MAVYKHSEDINDDKYYVYRHIRLDKNEPFYIGIASKCVWNKSYEKIFMRAYSKRGRSHYWNSIVGKTNYEVEVIYTTNNRDELQEKEREFIKLYGMACNSEGTLCNLTGGGDYNYVSHPSTWEKRKAAYIKSGSYEKMVERFAKTYRRTKENFSGENSPVKKSIYVYGLDGVFQKEFITQTRCCDELKLSSSTVYKYTDRPTNIYGYILRSMFLGEKINISDFNINTNRKAGNNHQRQVGCFLLDTGTGERSFFNNLTELSNHFGYNRSWAANRVGLGNIFYKNFKIEIS